MTKTVVLVHGAWHGGWGWQAVVDGLAARGVSAIAPDRPGHGASTAPLSDLYGDAEAIAEVVRGIDGPVVLAGHSYGGAVITEAAALTDNVEHLVFVTAFCLEVGQTVGGAAAEWPEHAALGRAIRPGADGALVLDRDLAIPALYNTCDPVEAAAAFDRCGPQGAATFGQPIRVNSWATIPSTFAICEQDRAIVPSLQRHMAERCGTVVSWDTDHSPFLCRPELVVDLLAGIAGA